MLIKSAITHALFKTHRLGSARNDFERSHSSDPLVVGNFQFPRASLLRLSFIWFRHHAYDPMHQLWLCVAESVWHTWRALELISEKDLSEISRRVNSIRLQSDIPNFCSKISQNMAWMKAVEWQSWVLVYFLLALNGIIPDAHFEAWKMFVFGCSIVCQSSLTRQEVRKAEQCLRKFAELFSSLVPWYHVKTNFHFMLHIPSYILQFGSIYNWQCNAYERLNGYLGNQPTNFKGIELQVFKRLYSRTRLDDSLLNHLDRRSGERFSISGDLLAELKSSFERRSTVQNREFFNCNFSGKSDL